MNDNPPTDNATAFLVPSTTRFREWESVQETYLWNVFCKSLENHCPSVPISVFVGYDEDDPIYSQEEKRLAFNAVFMKFNIIWVPQNEEKGNVVAIWNNLYNVARKHKFEWFQICGDDIRFPNDSSWLRVFQKQLVKQNYIGWAAGWSNNDNIATQFLIHNTHWQIFEFVFPPAIKNWYCDDWMNEVYTDKFKYWRRDYPLLNVGGNPRYNPKMDNKLKNALVRRHKKDLIEFLNLVNGKKKLVN
jgi:hypothetical protein